jgi:hypothetical protein
MAVRASTIASDAAVVSTVVAATRALLLQRALNYGLVIHLLLFFRTSDQAVRRVLHPEVAVVGRGGLAICYARVRLKRCL